MDILALVLILLSVFAMAIGSNWSRWLMRTKGFREMELLIVRCGVGGVITCLIPYLLLDSYWQRLNVLHHDAALFWMAVIGTTAVNAVIQYVNMRAYRVVEISFTAPIAAMTPGLVMMTTLALGEVPSTLGFVGIGMIIVGTYAHAREGTGWKTYFEPFFIWRAFGSIEQLSDESKKKRLGLRFAYTGAVFATFGLTFDGLLARYGNPALGVTVELLALTAIYLFLFFVVGIGKGKQTAFAGFYDRAKQYWMHLIGLGITFGLPFILLVTAFTEVPIAYVGSMKRLTIFLTMLIAFWGFRELSQAADRQRRRRRLILSLIIVSGAVILGIDPTEPHLVSGVDEIVRRLFGR